VSGAGPGRSCPVSYCYGAKALARDPDMQIDTLWIAGGLYGNPFALERLLALYEREPGSKALVFNGDFHWFDCEEGEWLKIDMAVQRHVATRGNVESELAAPLDGAGCGCAYPEWVDDGTVERSNRIIERLRAAAPRAARERLAALPMHLVAAVGGERVAVVHGDADSLAGWGFSQEILGTSEGRAAAVEAFERAKVRIFASSHTCLPVLACFPDERVVVNNGAAGMPNFRGTQFGLATRISVFAGKTPVYAQRAAGLFVEAIGIDYDATAWQRRFVAQWPAGSDAHLSYYQRIASGPRYSPGQALRQALRRNAAAAA
jgi:hypothetical protein